MTPSPLPANNPDQAASDISQFPGSDVLSRQKLFQGIPPRQLEAILRSCSVRYLTGGEVLIHPGQENHYLYLLISGRLQVCLDTADSQTGIPVEPGNCIGEMSIIDGRETSAYVVAEQDCTLLLLPDSVFWEKFMPIPGAARNLMQVLTNRMRKDNQLMLDNLAQQLRFEHLQKELATAGKIQANILPQEIPLFPYHPHLDVCAVLNPASEVGGDFYDAFALDEEHVCLAVGDVSGKGMPAALFMVRVVTLLRMSLAKDRSFATVLPEINRILCENNADCMFVTLFVGVLNVTSGQFVYVNGGHNPPLFARHNQPFAPLPMPKGMLLGVFEQARYPVAEITLRPGDAIVMYTDGVTEAENTQKAVFSEARTVEVLSSDSPSRETTQLVKSLEEAIRHFSKGQPQSDDITILALRYLAPPN